MKKEIALALLFAFIMAGCNAYSFMDKPSGDQQLLSAARACFDQGDFTCASNYYSKLSPASSDTQNSEEAYLILNQNGAGMGTFLASADSNSSNGGSFISSLAANLATANRGATARVNIFTAFQKTNSIQDTATQGLVRFITASAFLAEILAENSATLGAFKSTDVVSDPANCNTTTVSGCKAPASNVFLAGTSLNLSTATAADIANAGNGSQPTLYMIVAAVNQIITGVNQMGATGSLGTSTTSFATAIQAAASTITDNNSPLFREVLLAEGLGGS